MAKGNFELKREKLVFLRGQNRETTKTMGYNAQRGGEDRWTKT
jgi:hypothetical protein